MGFGKVNLFVARLLRRLGPNEYIIVICGSNQKLRKVLHTAFGRHPQVRILGYTEHISAYMDACDVIFTKPGGLTSTEADPRMRDQESSVLYRKRNVRHRIKDRRPDRCRAGASAR